MTNTKFKTASGTCPWTSERTPQGQHRDTNNKDNKENNIYSYFIYKYNALESKRFNDKMRFFRDMKNDEKYKQLSEQDEYRIRDYIWQN